MKFAFTTCEELSHFARCLDIEIAIQGKRIDDAVANLEVALSLSFDRSFLTRKFCRSPSLSSFSRESSAPSFSGHECVAALGKWGLEQSVRRRSGPL
jgi:hypothetical protein